MKIAIIGCGRSGTTFIAKHLQSLGFDIGHEKKGKDGISWSLNTVHDLSDYLVLHQVRNPIQTIASVHTLMESSWVRILKETGIPSSDSLLLRCMKYWVMWNLIAEKKAILTYRVEDIVSVVPTNTNTRKHLQLTIQDLENEDADWAQRVKDLATKYGYTI